MPQNVAIQCTTVATERAGYVLYRALVSTVLASYFFTGSLHTCASLGHSKLISCLSGYLIKNLGSVGRLEKENRNMYHYKRM